MRRLLYYYITDDDDDDDDKNKELRGGVGKNCEKIIKKHNTTQSQQLHEFSSRLTSTLDTKCKKCIKK